MLATTDLDNLIAAAMAKAYGENHSDDPDADEWPPDEYDPAEYGPDEDE